MGREESTKMIGSKPLKLMPAFVRGNSFITDTKEITIEMILVDGLPPNISGDRRAKYFGLQNMRAE